MKKNFTLLTAIILSLFSLTANAQDDKPTAKSYMTFTGGISNPLGDYASSIYTNNNAGFAKKGTTFGFDFGLYIKKNFGIGINLSLQDQGELNATDVQNLANGYNANFTKNQTSVTAVGRFTNLALMVGPQYSFLYKSFILDLRASGGIIKSFTTPATTIVAYPSDNGQTYYQLSSGAVALAYGASIGLRYTLSDSWDVGVKLNYIQSSGLKISNTGGDTAAQSRFQTNMPVSMLQSTLGMTLKF